ncbi:OsmC family protein [Acidiferrobacter sp.]|jgi:putative redox protein|uniref:OsmC family protein n=1 Tax=Acidiferrobacter sp. TaxID=1872107 RepID=UPI00262DA817|nr:OsmC family protein [Acidiferrobacter sp.]
MKAVVEWDGGAAFTATTESGHRIAMDGPPDHGGRNLGPRPTELVLAGMGGCTSFDVVHILRKGRADVRACSARIEAERAGEDPKVFTRMHVHFVVSGRELKEAAVERAIRLSAEKYCSVSIMLGKTAEISHSFEIVDVE